MTKTFTPEDLTVASRRAKGFGEYLWALRETIPFANYDLTSTLDRMDPSGVYEFKVEDTIANCRLLRVHMGETDFLRVIFFDNGDIHLWDGNNYWRLGSGVRTYFRALDLAAKRVEKIFRLGTWVKDVKLMKAA